MNRTRIIKRHRDIDQKILEAEEKKGRGDPSGAVALAQLKREQQNQPKELKQADDKDYRTQKRLQREKRNKYEKGLDALRGDL